MNVPTTPRFDATYLAWNTVGSYDSHEDVQAAVGRLSTAGFPVEHLDIVGSDVRILERVTGRLTRGRAALAGAASGVWTGLFVGFLFSLFASGPSVLAALLTGLVIGVATGAAFGYLGQAGTRGKREFASLRSMVAARYDLVARDGFADQARNILARGDQPAGFVPA